MADITKIPLEDLDALRHNYQTASFMMCAAVAMGATVDGKSLQERLEDCDTNIASIDEELARREEEER